MTQSTSSIAQKVAYNVVVNAVSKILSTVLALVSIGFITRYLGPQGFGEYTTALAFFALFVALADFGLNTVSAREISKQGAPEKRIMSNVFALRLGISTILLVVAPIFIFFFPYPNEIKGAILLSLAAFFFSSSYTIFNGIFQKNLAMDRVAATELVGKVLQLLLIILAIHMDWGLYAIMGAFVFFMFFNFVVLFFLSRKFVRFGVSYDINFWKTFLSQSFPLGVAVMITFLYFKFDTILLSLMQGSEAVGIFGAAYKIIENVTFFPAMIAGLVLPILSQRIHVNKEGFRKVADAMAKTFTLIVIPMVIGGVMLSRDIILLVGGPEFEASILVLQMLLFALAFMFFGHFFNTLLIVANYQKRLMLLLAVCAICNLSLNFVLIPQYSYLGSAITSVLTELLVVLLTGWSVYRLLDYRIRFYKFGRIALSGVVMAGSILLLDSHIHFFLTLIVAIAVYTISIMGFRAIERHEWEIFLRRVPQREE